MKYKYDLIFSLGALCFCSQALRKHFLQTFSYPFDWMGGSTFLNRCQIVKNNFERFIEKEDLEYSYEEKSINCFAYRNKFNGLIFNHDFLKDVAFDKMHKLVQEKYNRRIKRLFDKANKANSILIVYIEAPMWSDDSANEQIIEGYNILKEKFGDKLNLLYIKNTNNTDITEENLLDGKIRKISFYYQDKIHPPHGDVHKLSKVFKDYHLNIPFTYLLKKRLIKILINFIPNKELRRKARKKYHI